MPSDMDKVMFMFEGEDKDESREAETQYDKEHKQVHVIGMSEEAEKTMNRLSAQMEYHLAEMMKEEEAEKHKDDEEKDDD